MRVVMTGTRDFRDAEKVQAALKHVVTSLPDNEPLFVVHYATNMVDGYVDALCKLAGVKVQEIAPDWRADGKSALYRIHEKVIPGSDRVILFGRDAVTEHAITVANANGVTVNNVVPVLAVEALPI